MCESVAEMHPGFAAGRVAPITSRDGSSPASTTSIPGIGLAFISGAGAILTSTDRHQFWFSLPFGTGAGLTLDEIAVLTELDNPYWESEKLAAWQAAIAALGALALAGRLYQRGTRLR